MEPDSIRTWARVLRLALSLGALGCAPRGLPPSFPETSMASLEAEETRPARVVLALDEDPPMPGEDVDSWRGLRESDHDAERDAHRHHGGH